MNNTLTNNNYLKKKQNRCFSAAVITFSLGLPMDCTHSLNMGGSLVKPQLQCSVIEISIIY